MDRNPAPAAITVTRTVVLRVTDELDDRGVEQLRRILHDLIEGQGVNSLLVDLSATCCVDGRFGRVLAQAKELMERAEGLLELRAPVGLPTELLSLSGQIPTFTPLDGAPVPSPPPTIG